MKKKTETAEKLLPIQAAVMKPLSAVTRNSWNPNTFTEFQREALREGLKTEGWLGNPLIVWGRDEKDRVRNIIIDGEHRWEEAQKLGFKEGPMVFLHGITEAKAKSLTVAMDAKRGQFDQDKLGALLREIQMDLPDASFSLTLGIENDQLATLLAEDAAPLADVPVNAPPLDDGKKDDAPPPDATTRTVQIFLEPAQYDEWTEHMKRLAKKHKTNNITDTVLATLRAAK